MQPQYRTWNSNATQRSRARNTHLVLKSSSLTPESENLALGGGLLLGGGGLQLAPLARGGLVGADGGAELLELAEEVLDLLLAFAESRGENLRVGGELSLGAREVRERGLGQRRRGRGQRRAVDVAPQHLHFRLREGGGREEERGRMRGRSDGSAAAAAAAKKHEEGKLT